MQSSIAPRMASMRRRAPSAGAAAASPRARAWPCPDRPVSVAVAAAAGHMRRSADAAHPGSRFDAQQRRCRRLRRGTDSR